MGKRIQLEAVRARLGWSGLERCGHLEGSCRTAPLVADAEEFSPQMPPPLISCSDAAISKDLREQTRRVLAILSPHEAPVLRLRFRIDAGNGCTAEEVRRRLALPRELILAIESCALRKLRNPSWGR